jgi:hypothetical protein
LTLLITAFRQLLFLAADCSFDAGQGEASTSSAIRKHRKNKNLTRNFHLGRIFSKFLPDRNKTHLINTDEGKHFPILTGERSAKSNFTKISIRGENGEAISPALFTQTSYLQGAR